MRVFVVAAIAAALFLTPARADYSDGLAAFKRGDYVTAHMEFLRLAEQGNAAAQLNVGFLYHYGLGVEQNHSGAVKWYRKAAEQGLPEAQFSLGTVYESGAGGPRDLVQAYRWYSLVAETVPPGETRERLIKHRDRVAEQLSPDQLAVAESAPTPAGDPVDRGALTPSIAEIQHRLAERGLNPGPIDGQMGRRTVAALSAFQASHGLAITGQADELTLRELFGPDEVAPRLEPFPRVVVIHEEPAPDAVPVPLVEMISLDPLEQPAEVALFPSIDSGLSAGMLESGAAWVAVESGTPPRKGVTADPLVSIESETTSTDLVLPDYRSAEYIAVGTVGGRINAINPDTGERFTSKLTEDAEGPFTTDGNHLNGAATATAQLNDNKFDGWREEDRITLIQQRLSEAGFDPGPIDGKIGPQTHAALKIYQHTYNLTDQTFEELLDYMVASTHFESGYNYQKLGYHEKSLKEYSTAIRIRSNFPDAYFNRGLIYYSQNHYNRAIEDFSTVIELKPDDMKAYLNRANSYYEKGSYGPAAQDVYNAVKVGISAW